MQRLLVKAVCTKMTLHNEKYLLDSYTVINTHQVLSASSLCLKKETIAMCESADFQASYEGVNSGATHKMPQFK